MSTGRIMNLDRIHPIKRDLVAAILSQINGNRYLDKIIIFGSSIRNDCSENSDLDIAIKWTQDCFDEDYILKPFTLPVYRTIIKYTGGNDDIIPIGYEGNLKKSIEEGVVVYDSVHV
jgi:predicted nucleotidyltransferase